MKILVSGGTGFVGRFIVEDLLAAGHDVIVGGRNPPEPGFFSAPVRFAELRLDPDRGQSAPFDGVDAFVHAAFDHLPGRYRGGEGTDPDSFRRKNLDGSVALLRQARAAGVSRAVFLSSRAVYGPAPAGQLYSEDTPPRPDTLYGEVKLGVEAALEDMSGPGFRTASLRITGVYGAAGPGREDKWTPLIRDFLAGRAVAPRAGTEVHGGDVAQAVRIALAAEGSASLFNVSDLVIDRRDILAIAARVAGADRELPEPGSRPNGMAANRLRASGWMPGGRALFETTVERLSRALAAAKT